MFYVPGDRVFFSIFSLPNHALTQYPGTGAGTATHRAGDRYAARVVAGKIISIDRWNRLVKIWLPDELVFDGTDWVKPHNARGIAEKICWTVPLDWIAASETQALEIARNWLLSDFLAN